MNPNTDRMREHNNNFVFWGNLKEIMVWKYMLRRYGVKSYQYINHTLALFNESSWDRLSYEHLSVAWLIFCCILIEKKDFNLYEQIII